MKGSIMLTEGRSGSNWLTSIANSVGKLGHSEEWLTRGNVKSILPFDASNLLTKTLERASTANGYFSVKIFPTHVQYIDQRLNLDILKAFRGVADVKFILLTREDRLGQAISYAKAMQTQEWTRNHAAKGEEAYDFDLISRCYFMIDQSYSFWRSYLSINSIPYEHLIYEDMCVSPLPYLKILSDHAGIEVDNVPESEFTVQRNSSSNLWRERFLIDLSNRNIISSGALSANPKRSSLNLLRFLAGKPLRPYPFRP